MIESVAAGEATAQQGRGTGMACLVGHWRRGHQADRSLHQTQRVEVSGLHACDPCTDVPVWVWAE